MYRIYLLLCVLGTNAAKAFDPNDEAKYIDLLPEEEKQEFLNRIARRILEEIQSKDTPDESNVEVSDAQLNAHDAYVQDLLKEESKNMRRARNEARDGEDANFERDNSEDLEVKSFEHHKSDRIDKQHVDLTLRPNPSRKKRRNNDNRNDVNIEMTSDHPYEVIPVKVINDQDYLTNVVTVASTVIDPAIASISEDGAEGVDIENDRASENNSVPRKELNNKSLTEATSTNINKQDSVDINDSTIITPVKNTEENSNGRKIKGGDLDENLDVPKELTIVSNSKNNEYDNLQLNITHSVDETQINSNINQSNENVEVTAEFSTETTTILSAQEELVSYSEKLITSTANSMDEFGHIMLGNGELTLDKGLDDNDNNKQKSKNKRQSIDGSKLLNNASDTPNNNYKNVPLTIEKKNETGTVDGINKETSLPLLTTTPKAELISNLGSSEDADDRYTKPDVTSDVTLNGQTEENKKIKVLESKTTADQGVPSNDTNVTMDTDNEQKYLRQRVEILNEGYRFDEDTYDSRIKTPKHNKINEHYVYEVPGDKPPFVKEKVTSENEQPHFYPTYNFSPDYVYYNPHNRFGPNTDDREKEIGRSVNTNGDDEENLHLRDGFVLDIWGNKRNDYKKYIYEKENNLSKNMQKKEKLYSWDGNLLETKFDNPLYIDILRRSWSRHDKRARRPRWPNSKEDDHPYYSIHKANMKDHARAIRQLLYQQKKFGFLPSPYAIKTAPRLKRTFDEIDLNPHFRKRHSLPRRQSKPKNPNKGISVDYYFSRVNSNDLDYSNEVNTTEDVVSDLEISHTKEVTSKYVKLEKVKIKPKRRIVDEILDILDCGVDCMLKTDLKESYQLDDSINAMLNVLKDLIRRDDEDLASYNWLLSTVDIEAALQKLINLTKDAQKGKRMHPLDLGLLKYVVYLYISTQSIKEELINKKNSNLINKKNNLDTNHKLKTELSGVSDTRYTEDVKERKMDLLRKKIRMLPKNKRKKEGETIKHPLELWRSWYITFMRILDDKQSAQKVKNLKEFREFLTDLQDGLYDLHNAIKHLATISNYNNQNWYGDLQTIFLKQADRKRLLQILLHLEVSKLFTQIENSAKYGAEDDFVAFKRNNKEVVRASQEDLVYVLRILEELKTLDDYYFDLFLAAFIIK